MFIAEKLGVSQPTLSEHMHVLVQAKLNLSETAFVLRPDRPARRSSRS